jgi:hypothetical protein
MSTDDSRTSDHEPPDEHPRPGHSIHRQAVFGTEGLEVETSAVFVDDRPQTSGSRVDAGGQGSLFASPNPGQRTLDGRDASMVPLFGDQFDRRPEDIVEEGVPMGYRSTTTPVDRVTPLSAFESHPWGNHCFEAGQ